MAFEKEETSATEAIVDVVGGGKLEECPICFEELDVNSSQTVVTLHCTHQFHLDCIGRHFNNKKKMLCPMCNKVQSDAWECSYNNVSNGAGNIYCGLDRAAIDITLTPITSGWDSLDGLPQFQPSPDSSSEPPSLDSTAAMVNVPSESIGPVSTEVTLPDAPFMFTQQTNDIDVPDDVLDMHITLMTIQRVSTAVGSGEDAESIWAEEQSLTPEGGWGEPSE